MMRFGSGTYNVRETEMSTDAVRFPPHRPIVCTVHFLDGVQQVFEMPKHAIGQLLLDRVFEHLELIEKDYFGLQFTDLTPEPGFMRWLEPAKSIRKQMQCPPYILHFRVKFYVSDPSKLLEEYTRYHFYLQLRKDILENRLVCPESSLVLLCSYAVQSELGDYCQEEHGDNYLEGFGFAPNQTPAVMARVAELHRQHRGQTPADAEFNFLDQAKRLDLYGVDLHRARDGQMAEIQIGVASFGIGIFQKAQKVNAFAWSNILKLSFKRKQFFVQLKSESHSGDTVLVFVLCSTKASKLLWKSCIEHHTFFRLLSPPAPTSKAMFSFGSQFRYSGRTEHQTVEEMKRRVRMGRTFSRLNGGGSGSCFARCTIAGSPYSNRIQEGTVSSPTSFQYSGSSAGRRTPNPTRRTASSYSELIPSPSVTSDQRKTTLDGQLSTAARKMPVETTFGLDHSNSTAELVDNDNVVEQTYEVPSCVRPLVAYAALHKDQVDLKAPSHRRLGPKRGPSLPMYQRQASVGRLLDGNEYGQLAGGCSQRTVVGRLSSSSTAGGQSGQSTTGVNGFAPSSVLGGGGGLANGFHLNISGDDALVTIRMRPDSQGRFGFNVKGGCDQNYPIIVSRVIPGSPADNCFPRLNEGDQVLYINGNEVSHCTHEQVVRYIRACKEAVVKELVLVVRPNAYIGEEVEEPDQFVVPQTPHVADCVPRADLLHQSLLLLKDSLASGSALIYFEKLYRKSPSMTMNVAKYSENLVKNRYRDISPYDKTRVIVQNGSGDYINASYVNMEIPTSGIVNRYIAAQGPLPHTTADFWLVVWEQLCHTVVMLTATVERGRTKCHQYWPRLYESQVYGNLQITCVKEREMSVGAVRELSILHLETKEERLVSHMQYSAWPDHGVPDDSKELVDFVVDVRRSRTGMVEPVLVHCSAGIGRTGVMILLETAMCLIEAGEPIYPLDIVKNMRDQRAMLIQTASQYKFACDAILKIYNEGIVRPLEEYFR